MLANLLNPLASWSVPLLLLGLGLALAFGRRHTVWLALLALLATLSLESAPGFARWWLPGLMVLVCALRDPGLLAWRALALAAAVALGWQFAQGSGHAVMETLARVDEAVRAAMAPWGLAVLLGLTAAAVSLLRWTVRGWPIDLGNALASALVAAALGSSEVAQARGLLALAGVVYGAGVLWAAYRMAFIDPLTGLPNRRALDERLAQSGWKLAIAMVDVDFFKKFNDRYGHDNGDQVLRAVARELAHTRGAMAYRYGGEEFSLVFSGRQLARAEAVLEDLRGRVEAMRVRLAGNAGSTSGAQAVRKGQRGGEVGCTISIGMAERAAERRSTEAVMKAADQALYKAKQKGRNRVVMA